MYTDNRYTPINLTLKTASNVGPLTLEFSKEADIGDNKTKELELQGIVIARALYNRLPGATIDAIVRCLTHPGVKEGKHPPYATADMLEKFNETQKTD